MSTPVTKRVSALCGYVSPGPCGLRISVFMFGVLQTGSPSVPVLNFRHDLGILMVLVVWYSDKKSR